MRSARATIQKNRPRKNNGSKNHRPCPNPHIIAIYSLSLLSLYICSKRSNIATSADTLRHHLTWLHIASTVSQYSKRYIVLLIQTRWRIFLFLYTIYRIVGLQKRGRGFLFSQYSSIGRNLCFQHTLDM